MPRLPMPLILGLMLVPGAALAQEPALPGPLDPVAPPVAEAPAPQDRPGLLPAFIYGNGVFDAERPDLVMTVRGGVRFSPAYFGSTKMTSGPDAAVRVDHLTFPGGFTLGSNDTVGFQRGFGVRLSGRYITRRASDLYPEIDGLDTIPFTIEAGVGLGYEEEHYRGFANVRYGVVGTNAWVADLGADAIAYPAEGLSLTLGPRLNFGTRSFMDTYFGVSDDESAASGLAAYDPSSGIYGAGMEFGARYLFNERWGIEGAARWTKLVGSAADSPIVQQGTNEQYFVRFDLTRRISLDF